MVNFLATMPGPQFLLFYGLCIALTLGACAWWVRRSDPTRSLPLLPVPSRPDPYEVAYLRGGNSEVTRLALFSLLKQGYVRVTEAKSFLRGAEQRIEPVPEHPDPGRLSPLERAVFERLRAPHTPAEIFESSAISTQVREHCSSYDYRFSAEQLTTPPEAQQTALWAKILGCLLIVGLGGYKLLVAFAKGHHNVSFLIFLGLFSLSVFCAICSAPRLSARGKKYLEQLQLAFDPQKQCAPRLVLKQAAGETYIASEPDQLLLLMGILGAEVLSGTAYDQYKQLFSAKTAGGCGDGGCGGGCGGCGGCG